MNEHGIEGREMTLAEHVDLIRTGRFPDQHEDSKSGSGQPDHLIVMQYDALVQKAQSCGSDLSFAMTADLLVELWDRMMVDEEGKAISTRPFGIHRTSEPHVFNTDEAHINTSGANQSMAVPGPHIIEKGDDAPSKA